MTSLVFRLTGPFIPYVRMTRRGKFVNARAQAYLSNQDALRWQIMAQMSAKNYLRLPDATPLRVLLTFHLRRMHAGDLDNLIKAVLDAAQSVLFSNDCWIDSISACRVPTGAEDVCNFEIAVIEKEKVELFS